MDRGNEFRGSKNGGREVWVGLEWPENKKIRRPTVAAVAAFTGPIWARPAVVRHEIWQLRSSGDGAPPWLARVARGWPVAPPTTKNLLVSKWVETTQFGVHGLGEFFLGFYLARKNRFI